MVGKVGVEGPGRKGVGGQEPLLLLAQLGMSPGGLQGLFGALSPELVRNVDGHIVGGPPDGFPDLRGGHKGGGGAVRGPAMKLSSSSNMR